MDSFEAKIGWRTMWKTENKNYRSVLFLPDAKWKIPKKQQKKLKILKKIIMASFQAKICQKMVRERENKNYRSFPFLTDANWKIPKKQQKN